LVAVSHPHLCVVELVDCGNNCAVAARNTLHTTQTRGEREPERKQHLRLPFVQLCHQISESTQSDIVMRSQRLLDIPKHNIAKLDARPERKGEQERPKKRQELQGETFESHSGCPASAAAMRPLPSFSLSLQRFTDRRPHLEKARTKTRTKREPPDQHHQTSPVPHPASNFPCFQNHETLALFCCFLPPWASHGTSFTTFFDAAAAAFSPQQNPLHVHFADRRPCLMPAVYRNRSH
ncbi:hypothetical protein CLIM01_02114, partial [Colletotrichum limetticola]